MHQIKPRKRYFLTFVDDDVVGRIELDRLTFFEIADGAAVKPHYVDHRGEKYLIAPVEPSIAKRERRLRAVHIRHVLEATK